MDGDDMADLKKIEKEYDKIMKINYYLLKKYRSEIFEEFGIPEDGDDVETMRKIMDAFDRMYKEVQAEMPLMWYEYGFGSKEYV